MKKWVGKQVLVRISDIRIRFMCVCFLQFDWLIFLGNYYHVGFKKGREAVRGRSSCIVKVDFDFSLVKSEVQVAL